MCVCGCVGVCVGVSVCVCVCVRAHALCVTGGLADKIEARCAGELEGAKGRENHFVLAYFVGNDFPKVSGLVHSLYKGAGQSTFEKLCLVRELRKAGERDPCVDGAHLHCICKRTEHSHSAPLQNLQLSCKIEYQNTKEERAQLSRAHLHFQEHRTPPLGAVGACKRQLLVQ